MGGARLDFHHDLWCAASGPRRLATECLHDHHSKCVNVRLRCLPHGTAGLAVQGRLAKQKFRSGELYARLLAQRRRRPRAFLRLLDNRAEAEVGEQCRGPAVTGRHENIFAFDIAVHHSLVLVQEGQGEAHLNDKLSPVEERVLVQELDEVPVRHVL